MCTRPPLYEKMGLHGYEAITQPWTFHATVPTTHITGFTGKTSAIYCLRVVNIATGLKHIMALSTPHQCGQHPAAIKTYWPKLLHEVQSTGRCTELLLVSFPDDPQRSSGDQSNLLVLCTLTHALEIHVTSNSCHGQSCRWTTLLIGQTEIDLDAKNFGSGHQTAFGWLDGDETNFV